MLHFLPSGRRRAGLLLVIGAALYALMLGPLGLTFNATPLLIGAIALGAGLLGPSEGLVPPSLGLLGWGAAVLLVLEGPVPDDRAAPAYLVGAGLGVLAAIVVSRLRRGAAPAAGAAVAVVVGGLSLYLAFEYETFGDWPLWAVSTAAWGLVEAVRGDPARSRRPPAARESSPS